MAKPEKRNAARKLRAKGWSVKQIKKRLGVSRASVSVWVRDVELSQVQQDRLANRRRQGGRRGNRQVIRHSDELVNRARREAADQWDGLRRDPSFLFGLAVYVAEGYKSGRSKISICNTDPSVLRLALRFLEIAGLARSELRFLVHLPRQGGVEAEVAIDYWAGNLAVDRSQFYRCQVESHDRKRPCRYPHGICHIEKGSVFHRAKIDMWSEIAMSEFASDAASATALAF